MPQYLGSCDSDSGRIYKHQGFSSTILDSFPSPASGPSGLGWDGENLLSCDYASDRIYKHQGFSSTILDSFPSLDTTPMGLAWDGENLLSCDAASDRIYKHQGFSSTILDSFPSLDTLPAGLAWDGENLLSCDVASDRIYKHQGFSSTILDSFPSYASPQGLGWDGENLLGCDAAFDRIYKHQGFSSTILDSFPSPGTNPTGLSRTVVGSVVVTYVYHGATPTGEQADNIRFKAADDNVQDFTNTIKIPTSGSNYSYWKHVAPVAVSPPANFINNVKFYVQGSVDWPGCTLRVAQVTNYSQAIGTQGVTGAEASANHPDHPTMVDVNNYTQTNPLRLSGSIGPTTGKIIDGYLLMQLEVTPSATAGITSQVTFVWEYDEA